MKYSAKQVKRAGWRYTHAFNNAVNADLPKSILEAMSNLGWNPLGIYEHVKDIRAAFRRKKQPVYLHEASQ